MLSMENLERKRKKLTALIEDALFDLKGRKNFRAEFANDTLGLLKELEEIEKKLGAKNRDSVKLKIQLELIAPQTKGRKFAKFEKEKFVS